MTPTVYANDVHELPPDFRDPSHVWRPAGFDSRGNAIFEVYAAPRNQGLGFIGPLIQLGTVIAGSLLAGRAQSSAQSQQAGQQFEAAAAQARDQFIAIRLRAQAGQVSPEQARQAGAELFGALEQLAASTPTEYVARKWAEYRPAFQDHFDRLVREASAAFGGSPSTPGAGGNPATPAPFDTSSLLLPAALVLGGLLLLRK